MTTLPSPVSPLGPSRDSLLAPAGLDRAIDQAARVALEGKPWIVVNLSFSLDLPDPWRLLDDARGGQPGFAWAEPVRGSCFAARGALLSFPLTGPQRFVAAAEICSRIDERQLWLGEAAAHRHTPHWLAGFAFDPDEQSGAWRRFGPGQLRMPRDVALRDVHGRGRVVLRRVMHRGDDPAELARELSDTCDELRQRLAAETGDDRSERATDGATLTRLESERDWSQRVRDATGDLDECLAKVVLARAVRVDAQAPIDALAVARRLRATHTGDATFLWQDEHGDSFVGCSPETLLDVQGRGLQTHALAGTALRDSDAASDEGIGHALLHSDKDRREHAAVVEDIIGALAPLCERLSHDDGPALRSSRTLHHLCTPMQAHMRAGVSAFDALEALHPTAALGGHPRSAAMRYLADHEPTERGWYGAPIGWLSPSQARFVVAIRSALISGEHATAYAGAGIVSGSDPSAEWGETENKLATVLEPLGLASPMVGGGP